MENKEIEIIIDHKIRQHEKRVAWISGIIGATVLAGLFHAIALNHEILSRLE